MKSNRLDDSKQFGAALLGRHCTANGKFYALVKRIWNLGPVSAHAYISRFLIPEDDDAWSLRSLTVLADRQVWKYSLLVWIERVGIYSEVIVDGGISCSPFSYLRIHARNSDF